MLHLHNRSFPRPLLFTTYLFLILWSLVNIKCTTKAINTISRKYITEKCIFPSDDISVPEKSEKCTNYYIKTHSSNSTFPKLNDIKRIKISKIIVLYHDAIAWHDLNLKRFSNNIPGWAQMIFFAWFRLHDTPKK